MLSSDQRRSRNTDRGRRWHRHPSPPRSPLTGAKHLHDSRSSRRDSSSSSSTNRPIKLSRLATRARSHSRSLSAIQTRSHSRSPYQPAGPAAQFRWRLRPTMGTGRAQTELRAVSLQTRQRLMLPHCMIQSQKVASQRSFPVKLDASPADSHKPPQTGLATRLTKTAKRDMLPPE